MILIFSVNGFTGSIRECCVFIGHLEYVSDLYHAVSEGLELVQLGLYKFKLVNKVNMPIHKVTKIVKGKKKTGYQFGNHGAVYSSKQGAIRQMKAMFANGYKEHK